MRARGIQHRGIYLVPPGEDDLAWVAASLDREELWRSFGYARPAGALFLARRRELELLIVHRAVDQRRLGFVVVFPPSASMPVPELAYAIPRRQDRDAFTAIAAADAACAHLFETRGLPELGWRTLASNLAAQAILRRLGYPPREELRIDGHRYVIHRLERAAWAARRARLEAAERRRPSGLGGVFRELEGPPWRPVPVKPSCGSAR